MTIARILKANRQQVAAVLCLLVVFAALSTLNPFVFETGNILNIGKQASINLIIALGMTVVILSGGIDLSVGSLLAFVVVVAARLNTVNELNIWLATAIGALGVVLLGALNGIVIQYGRVPPFIATLGSLGIVRGVVLNLSHGHPGMTFPPEFLWIADGTILGAPVPILIAVAMALAVAFVLRYTVTGRSCYALGGNEEATRLSGIDVARTRIVAYGISGFCCAVAGIVFAARVGAAPPGAGQGYELNAIAAVIIGGTPLNGGQGTIFGTAVGALLIAVIQNGLTILNVDPYWQGIIVGLIIVVAVMASNLQRRRKLVKAAA